MRSESNFSEVAEEKIPTIDNYPPSKQYITYQEVLANDSNNKLYQLTHEDCRDQHIDWKQSLSREDQERQGVHIINSRCWHINRHMPICCQQLSLEMKVLIRRNSKFEICKVQGSPNRERGLKYVLEGSGMTVKLSVVLVTGEHHLIWKEIQIPETSLQPEIQHNIAILERPDGIIEVSLNDFFFCLSISQPCYPNLNLAFKGIFQVKAFNLQIRKFVSQVTPNQCGIKCSLF